MNKYERQVIDEVCDKAANRITELEAQLQALQSSNDKLVENLKGFIRFFPESHYSYEPEFNEIIEKSNQLLSSIPDNKPGE